MVIIHFKIDHINQEICLRINMVRAMVEACGVVAKIVINTRQ